jgi:hypothetical protein
MLEELMGLLTDLVEKEVFPGCLDETSCQPGYKQPLKAQRSPFKIAWLNTEVSTGIKGLINFGGSR